MAKAIRNKWLVYRMDGMIKKDFKEFRNQGEATKYYVALSKQYDNVKVDVKEFDMVREDFLSNTNGSFIEKDYYGSGRI